VDIHQIILANGLHLPTTDGREHNSIRAVTALDRLYVMGGAPLVHNVLRIIRRTWKEEKQAWMTDTLMGIGLFWVRYGEKLNEDRFVERLSLYSPGRIIIEARSSSSMTGHGELGHQVGTVLTAIYNKGLRSNTRTYLPVWEVYPKKVAAAK
jgi:hypothetical protein